VVLISVGGVDMGIKLFAGGTRGTHRRVADPMAQRMGTEDVSFGRHIHLIGDIAPTGPNAQAPETRRLRALKAGHLGFSTYTELVEATSDTRRPLSSIGPRRDGCVLLAGACLSVLV